MILATKEKPHDVYVNITFLDVATFGEHETSVAELKKAFPDYTFQQLPEEEGKLRALELNICNAVAQLALLGVCTRDYTGVRSLSQALSSVSAPTAEEGEEDADRFSYECEVPDCGPEEPLEAEFRGWRSGLTGI